MTKPRIRIVNDSGIGNNTRIYANNGSRDDDGNLIETDISGAVQEIDVKIKVGDANTATIKAILVGGEIDAEIIKLQAEVLPPPLPKTTYRLTVGEVDSEYKRCCYTLIRSIPLLTYGSSDEEIASGYMPGIGPLELVFEEKS